MHPDVIRRLQARLRKRRPKPAYKKRLAAWALRRENRAKLADFLARRAEFASLSASAPGAPVPAPAVPGSET
jgi:hypothetical protein